MITSIQMWIYAFFLMCKAGYVFHWYCMRFIVKECGLLNFIWVTFKHLMNIDIFWELFQALKTVNTNPGFRCCVNQERHVEIFEFFSFFKKFDLKHHACGSSEIIVCIWYENLNIVFIKLSRLYSSKICVSSSDSSQNMAATLFFLIVWLRIKHVKIFFSLIMV